MTEEARLKQLIREVESLLSTWTAQADKATTESWARHTKNIETKQAEIDKKIAQLQLLLNDGRPEVAEGSLRAEFNSLKLQCKNDLETVKKNFLTVVKDAEESVKSIRLGGASAVYDTAAKAAHKEMRKWHSPFCKKQIERWTRSSIPRRRR